MKVQQVSMSSINFGQTFNKSVVFKKSKDNFEKNVSFKSTENFTELQKILDGIKPPQYKTPYDFKKRLFGPSCEKQSFAHNSSEAMVQQTCKCVEAINAYLENQIKNGNIEILRHTTGTVEAKLADGTIINVQEPYGMNISSFDPVQRYLTVVFPDQTEFGLRAYSREDDHKMYDTRKIIESTAE